jgi:hypothetical protein
LKLSFCSGFVQNGVYVRKQSLYFNYYDYEKLFKLIKTHSISIGIDAFVHDVL